MLFMFMLGILINGITMDSVAQNSTNSNTLLRLHEDLLQHYTSSVSKVKPVRDATRTVNVKFSVSLVQIIDIDEKQQMMTSLIWKTHVWKDEFLIWDPKQYDGIKKVRLQAKSIWLPDVILYNSADMTELSDSHEENVVIHSTGDVYWIPPRVYKSSCRVEMENFPLDIQNCRYEFGSWSHDSHDMNLTFVDNYSDIDLTNYLNNLEWKMIEHRATKKSILYTCCDQQFEQLYFDIRLQRRGGFYLSMMIIPVLLVSYLTPLVFCIPPQRPDRTAYGMSLFSIFLLMTLVIVQISPPFGATKAGLFCTISIMSVAVAGALSIALLNLASNTTSKPPACVKKLITKIGPYLCACVPTSHQSDEGTFAWAHVVKVIDRILFVIYVIGILSCHIFYFPFPLFYREVVREF